MITFTKEQKKKIEKDYLESVELAAGRKYELFEALERCNETEALCFKFLLAYLPFTDLTNYSGEFFYNHVHSCLANFEKTPWHDEIDTETFLNFVLVPRINNENLEHYNQIIFDELWDRIKDQTIEEAVITINLWCFERATYASTDIRTVSPLTMMRNTNGRCGEESTFVTSAMRSCGIPARQTYTPRWAVSESNHAWTEVQIHGKWHFIGACEPDAFVDSGWYIAPATRAMLTNNRVFSGILPKNARFVSSGKRVTELNTLDIYAKTRDISVTVTEKGKPKKGVRVELSLINFGELYDFCDSVTDKDGKIFFTTGYGDLFITATKDSKILYGKIDVRENENVTLDWANAKKFAELPDEFEFDLIPPAPVKVPEFERPANAQEIVEKFRVRSKEAEKIRIDYKNTFYNDDSDPAICKKYPEYANDLKQFLIDAQGNAHKILAFADDPQNIADKVAFLKTLSRKDFGDCDNMILEKHFAHQIKFAKDFEDNRLTFERYLLSIRIANEWLSDYAPKIDGFFTAEQKAEFIAEPKKIAEYVENTVLSSADIDYNALVALPYNLLKTKRADGISKLVLQVAICRSLGIPARFTYSGTVEYWRDGEWFSMNGVSLKEELSAGLIPEAVGVEDAMRYVTLQKHENGNFTVLPMFRRRKKDGAAESADDNTIRLAPGEYRVLTFCRIKNGGMQAKMYHFTLQKGEIRQMTFKVRPEKPTEADALKTAFDAAIDTKDGKSEKISALASGKTLFAWLGVREEPTEHLFNEMLAMTEAYKAVAKNIYFILRNPKELDHATLRKVLELLPDINIRYYGAIPEEMYESLGTDDKRLPLVIVTDEKLAVSALSTGYNIGSAEMLFKAMK